MNKLYLPALTARAHHWFQEPGAGKNRIERALLSTVDGRRSVIELESVARAMRLPTDALEQLREHGLIVFLADEIDADQSSAG